MIYVHADGHDVIGPSRYMSSGVMSQDTRPYVPMLYNPPLLLLNKQGANYLEFINSYPPPCSFFGQGQNNIFQRDGSGHQ